MISQKNAKNHVAFRAQLLAELFLQELNPLFVGKPADPADYDFVISFKNQEKGINTFPVEIMATERPISKTIPLPRFRIARLADTAVPAMLMVVDVKLNEFAYAWIDSYKLQPARIRMGKIGVTKINSSTKLKLVKELTAIQARQAV